MLAILGTDVLGYLNIPWNRDSDNRLHHAALVILDREEGT